MHSGINMACGEAQQGSGPVLGMLQEVVGSIWVNVGLPIPYHALFSPQHPTSSNIFSSCLLGLYHAYRLLLFLILKYREQRVWFTFMCPKNSGWQLAGMQTFHQMSG